MTVKILEKKEQHVEGSVETKLKREYQLDSNAVFFEKTHNKVPIGPQDIVPAVILK